MPKQAVHDWVSRCHCARLLAAALCGLTGVLHYVGHTHTLLSSPKVDFCGYTVPHPMEPKMNLRLQTKDGFDATEVMKESLDVLVDIFDVVDKKFQKASKAFKPSS